MSNETSMFLFGAFIGFMFTLLLTALPAVQRIDTLNKQVKEQQELIYKTYNIPIIEAKHE